MIFYLGTHEPCWLGRTSVPLFISRRRFSRAKGLRGSLGRWALDSGGFSELLLYGRWETSAAQYAEEAQRHQDLIGKLDFAAIQDYMCEPFMIERTGLSLREHQRRTIQSFLDLKSLAPSVPWAPVLQGWRVDDYLRHAEDYATAGVDLVALDRVGVGSVCRRQASRQAYDIFTALRPLGLRLHGFGLKTGFFRLAFAASLSSADSLSWSRRARSEPPLPGCDHRSCANCLRFALQWREKVGEIMRRPSQTSLPF
jgi:hypothetical protein